MCFVNSAQTKINKLLCKWFIIITKYANVTRFTYSSSPRGQSWTILLLSNKLHEKIMIFLKQNIIKQTSLLIQSLCGLHSCSLSPVWNKIDDHKLHTRSELWWLIYGPYSRMHSCLFWQSKWCCRAVDGEEATRLALLKSLFLLWCWIWMS